VTAAATWLREAAGDQLPAIADLIPAVSTPQADALVTIGGLDSPVGPGSTIGAVAIVNASKVRTAGLLVEQAAPPPGSTRASAVVAERARILFDEAYREHARRLARAIGQQGGG